MLDQMMKMLEGQQIGPYRLNKFLGAGGFGGVFHASERGDPRPPYQGGIKGGSAPPLSRGDQGGIKGTIYLQFNNYNHSLNRIVTQRKNCLIQELLLC